MKVQYMQPNETQSKLKSFKGLIQGVSYIGRAGRWDDYIDYPNPIDEYK